MTLESISERSEKTITQEYSYEAVRDRTGQIRTSSGANEASVAKTNMPIVISTLKNPRNAKFQG
ncbi:hypothetical protein PRIPAC_86557, partial [Pristionchus pacificus]|uniref:Uncharacterized protein n=1 Tax=Pristionchus pacificus TaxID=54126 RepID=A0A2A6BDF9_PRIPA